MTVVGIEKVSFCDVIFDTPSGPNIFRYESPQRWEEMPLTRSSDISYATYPPVKRIATISDRPHDFPEYDMLIEEPDKPPILFTGAHSRLLYEITQGHISLWANAKRQLINLDRHDDFMLGSTEYRSDDIHIGNWVAGGAVGGYWGSYIHLDEEYEPVLPIMQSLEVIPVGLAMQTMPVSKVFTRYNFTQLQSVIKGLLDKTGDDPFIFSLDADSVADWGRTFTDDSSQMLKVILHEVLSRRNIELFHFTPSPAYCPAEEAVKVWDKFRDVWQRTK